MQVKIEYNITEQPKLQSTPRVDTNLRNNLHPDTQTWGQRDMPPEQPKSPIQTPIDPRAVPYGGRVFHDWDH